MLTVGELKTLGRRLDDAQLLEQLGPFVLVQSPVEKAADDVSLRATRIHTKRSRRQDPGATSLFELEELWVASLPPLRGEDRLVVGRGLDCDIVIDDETVSKHHASLWWDGRFAVLDDHRSLNGTFVNGRRIRTPTTLQNEDALSFGDVEAFFWTTSALRQRLRGKVASKSRR